MEKLHGMSNGSLVNAPLSKFQHRMGYLAVLLGNGSLEVWDVPLPHAMKSVYSSSNLEGTDPPLCKDKASIQMFNSEVWRYTEDYLVGSLEASVCRGSDPESSLSHGMIWFAIYGGSHVYPCTVFL
ncbi:hypothetical protein NC652_022099 [Populus alba x Populus x berolinensis]|nr:hypothetical protein NC652_022099 [Populus alba x Populus x berolinensis]